MERQYKETISKLQNSPILLTGGIRRDAEEDPEREYIFSCLRRFFSGDYGEIPAEDTESNRRELQAGTGRIVARYKGQGRLKQDFYIISYFTEGRTEPDYNYTSVLYLMDY